jgi:hypothetical protein
MPDLLKSKTLKARKVHRCMLCGAPAVQPGGTYERSTLILDGRVYDWVECEPCGPVATYAADDYWLDEGVTSEAAIAWAEDNRGESGQRGEVARAFLARAFPGEQR